jgi:hypothetical protein
MDKILPAIFLLAEAIYTRIIRLESYQLQFRGKKSRLEENAYRQNKIATSIILENQYPAKVQNLVSKRRRRKASWLFLWPARLKVMLSIPSLPPDCSQGLRQAYYSTTRDDWGLQGRYSRSFSLQSF